MLLAVSIIFFLIALVLKMFPSVISPDANKQQEISDAASDMMELGLGVAVVTLGVVVLGGFFWAGIALIAIGAMLILANTMQVVGHFTNLFTSMFSKKPSGGDTVTSE